MSELNVISIAEQKVEQFDLMSQHRQAMECRDCEEFLQSGIEAFKCIQWAEETLRAAVVEFHVDLPFEKTGRIIRTLYRQWFGPVEFARQWIAKNQANGYLPDNLTEFRAAVADCKKQIERSERDELLDDMATGSIFTQDFLDAQANRVR